MNKIFFLLLSSLFFSSTQICADYKNIETIVVQKEYAEEDFEKFKNLKGIHILGKDLNEVDWMGILLPFLNCPLTDALAQQINQTLVNSYKSDKKITIKTIAKESVLLLLVQEKQDELITDIIDKTETNLIKNELAEVPNEAQDKLNVSPNPEELNQQAEIPNKGIEEIQNSNSEEKTKSSPIQDNIIPPQNIDSSVQDNVIPPQSVGNPVQDNIHPSPSVDNPVQDNVVPSNNVDSSVQDNIIPPQSVGNPVQDNINPSPSVGNPVQDNVVPSNNVDGSVQDNIMPSQRVGTPMQEEPKEPAQSSGDSSNIPTNIAPETPEKVEQPASDEIKNNNAVESWRAEVPEENQDKAAEPSEEPGRVLDRPSESQKIPENDDIDNSQKQESEPIEVPSKVENSGINNDSLLEEVSNEHQETVNEPLDASTQQIEETKQATQDSEKEPVAVSEKDFPRLPEPPPASVTEPKVEKYSFHAIILLGSNKAFDRGLTQATGITFIDLKVPGYFDNLRQKLKPFLNKPLGPDELLSLKQIIIDYYQEQKHPLVSVQIPSQNVTNGVLRVLVIEGHLGGYSFSGNEWFSTKLLNKYVRLKKGEVVDEIRLIEDLNLMNRNPFRRVDVVYSPGEESRTTDVEFLVKDRFPLRPYAGAENNGIETIGRQRFFAGVNWGNAFGADQLLSYQCTASYDFKKFQAHTGQYMVPLPWRDILLLYGGYSWVDVHIPNMPTAKSKGHSMQASARYLLPLRPTKTFMHDLIFGFDFKRLNSTVEFSAEHPIFDGNINISQFVLGYNWNLEQGILKSSFDINLFYSPGQMLPDQSDKDFDTFRPFAKSDYLYGLASWATLISGKAGSLSVLLKGQVASRNLIASEEFGLGGYDTVRGYEERIYNGDNGFLVRTEIATPPFSILKHIWCKAHDSLKFLGFLDYGWANVHKNSSNSDQFGPSSEYLMGAGPGLRYVINPYVSLRFDCGFKLHKNEFLGHKEKMYHFSVTVGY